MEAQVSLLTINAISAVSALEWQQIASIPCRSSNSSPCYYYY